LIFSLVFPIFQTRFLVIAAAMLGVAVSAHADPVPSFTASPPSLSDMDRGNPTGAHLSPEAKKAAEAGIVAMGKDNFAAAETAFLKLLKLSPDNISGLINLGLTEFRLGRAEEAQKYLQRAVRLKPDAALAWTMLGVIAMNQHDQEAATAALAQAVYLNPKSPQAHNYFAVNLAQRGWYSGAEDELQKVIQLAPDFADAHFNLALLYLQQTPPAVELARRHYQKALDLGAPPDPVVAAKLAAAPLPTTIP
jgi:tetratricopeptide (TPR) repeat protein